MNIARAQEILQHQFGYDSFRLNQEQAIAAVLQQQDCVVLMPTGGGKSLCYQIPALMLDGLTLVVSPLIALMKDQVDALKNNGIHAAFLNSTQSGAEQGEVFRAIRNNELKLLYVAPERLLQSGDQFLDYLRGLNIALFAIDEAHCISSWGHDFRPEYLQLAKLKTHFPAVPLLALTATADKLVRNDILERLSIQHAAVFVSSFNRPNIFYTIEPKRDSYNQLLEFLSKRKGESGIIYRLSRQSVENLAADLRADGFAAQPYHAGLDKETRDRHQTLFLQDEVKIIVATIAFGMGIDKSNVRFVVHMDLPKNIESYYQETGRAGRDGLQSDALLFFSWGDVNKLKSFAAVEGNEAQSEIMLNKLNTMGKFGDLRTCRRKFLLNYFSEDFAGNCGACDNCLKTFETFDGTIIAQKALSAVARVQERFGLQYLIDFLRGSESKTIRAEHKALKTYGVGADISRDDWFEYFRDLIAQDFLVQSDGQYPVIALTEKSAAVLRGQVQVQLMKVTRKADKRDSLVSAAALPYAKDLFEELKQLRLTFAQRENVPPYVIFSDATLVELATYLPQSSDELSRMSGVGDVKLNKYGADFLRTIIRYCDRHQLASLVHLKVQKRDRKSHPKRDARGHDTYTITLELFKTGHSVAAIAKARGLAISTIETHLVRFIPSGEIVLEDIVAAHKIEPIRQALLALNAGTATGPVKEYLGDEYSYGEIRAVIAEFLRQGEDSSACD
jgi:ATP-dependent DNA helicase RecQ